MFDFGITSFLNTLKSVFKQLMGISDVYNRQSEMHGGDVTTAVIGTASELGTNMFEDFKKNMVLDVTNTTSQLKELASLAGSISGKADPASLADHQTPASTPPAPTTPATPAKI